jgi:hypothetical protein
VQRRSIDVFFALAAAIVSVHWLGRENIWDIFSFSEDDVTVHLDSLAQPTYSIELQALSCRTAILIVVHVSKDVERVRTVCPYPFSLYIIKTTLYS